MPTLLSALAVRWAALGRDQEGAIGWLILGILIGIGLVIWAIIALLIPGD